MVSETYFIAAVLIVSIKTVLNPWYNNWNVLMDQYFTNYKVPINI